MDYKNKIENLRTKYSLFENQNTDIISQISLYNDTEINDTIEYYNDLLEKQKLVNISLKQDNSKINKKNLDLFVNSNYDNIEKQNEQLDNIFNELKKITNENDELIKNNQKYKEITEQDDLNKVANKIKCIKSTCDNIKRFLIKRGLISS